MNLPETRYALSGGQSVAYQVYGDRDVDLIYCAEFWNSIEAQWMEPRFEAFLRRLASFSRLIMFDQRGTGLSDPVSTTELPPLEQWIDDSESEPNPRCQRCENGGVSSTGVNDYCSFSKAVEHLGDRWSLPILAQLVLLAPRGFNDFATGLPGHVSRSVLAEKLRKFEDLGLISRDGGGRRPDPYRLTAASNELAPTILALRGWAETWLPDDVATIERDPDIVLGWLTKRIDIAGLPERQAIVEVTMRHENEHRCWLVLERGIEPYGCFDDPMIDESRYVYVDGGMTVILALARGRRGWAEAIADGSIVAFGVPDLVRQLPSWFHSVDESAPRDAARPKPAPSGVALQRSPASPA